MNILVVAFEYPPFPGGQATYAVEMARALHAMGHTVRVLAPAYEAPPPDDGFPVVTTLAHQRLDLAALRATWRMLRQRRDEVILCCDIRASLLLAMLPVQGARVLAMYHGGEVLHGRDNARYRAICRLSAFRKQSLVANSRYSADLARQVIGRAVRAIPLGVSPFWLATAQPPQSPLLQAALAGRHTVFCLAARLERRKGHLEVFQSFLRLGLHRDPGIVFVFSGKAIDPDYHAEIREWLARYPQSFVHVGELSREDVRAMYAASTALLLFATPQPRHIEGFGLVITEAAAQGCPVLTTRVGGIPDAVDDGISGLVVAPQDSMVVDVALKRFLQEPALRVRLAAGARARAVRDTWADVARKTLE